MEEHQGFTLAELLIAVTIIALLAAIVLPNLLRSRVAADESAAIDSIRQINRAETAYQAAYPSLGFSGDLTSLGPGGVECHTRSPEHACLLDSKLASASSPGHSRGGYWFLVTPGSKDPNGVLSGYLVGSAAAVYNQSGVRDFCSTEDGVVHFRVPHQQSSPVTSASDCHRDAVLQ
jgi:type IV pilus assembly protein PilA